MLNKKKKKRKILNTQKDSFSYRKKFLYFIIPLKINGGILISSRGSGKNQKSNKAP